MLFQEGVANWLAVLQLGSSWAPATTAAPSAGEAVRDNGWSSSPSRRTRQNICVTSGSVVTSAWTDNSSIWLSGARHSLCDSPSSHTSPKWSIFFRATHTAAEWKQSGTQRSRGGGGWVGGVSGGGGRVEYRKQTAAYKTWSHSQRQRDMNVYGGGLLWGGGEAVGGAPPAYCLMLSSGELWPAYLSPLLVLLFLFFFFSPDLGGSEDAGHAETLSTAGFSLTEGQLVCEASGPRGNAGEIGSRLLSFSPVPRTAPDAITLITASNTSSPYCFIAKLLF